jgi:uncharacterized protein
MTRGMTFAALVLMVGALWPGPGQAQDWATRDVCTVTDPAIDPAALSTKDLSALRQETAAVANPVGRFWRIQSPGGAVSHLWGTMHASDPLILDLPEIVIDRIQTARMVTLEADFIAPTRAAHREQLAMRDWYRDPGSRYDFDTSGLPDHVISWIRARTEAQGWGPDAADYLTFGGLAELILSDPCEDFASGTLPDQDSRIQMLAMIAGAQVMGLEGADDFTRHLNRPENAATALAVLALGGAYLQPRTSPARRRTGFALYLQGESALSRAWDRRILREFYGPDLGDAYLSLADDYLLTARNLTFLETALPELQQGGVFMAIGSFHLAGHAGMIELLRGRGFTVTRIPLPGENPGN